MQKQHDICTQEGCGRPHKARGYCQTHYMQFKRGVTPVGEISTRVRVKPEECSESDCRAPVKSKGLCHMHYQRKLRHGHTRYTDRKRPVKGCRIDGCGNYSYASELCHAHYIKQLKWRKHGVDADRYQEMLREQKGLCAICRKPERAPDKASGKIKDLAIDHNHATGQIRALLCSACNTALGLFNDDPRLLDAAKHYLAKHPAPC